MYVNVYSRYVQHKKWNTNMYLEITLVNEIFGKWFQSYPVIMIINMKYNAEMESYFTPNRQLALLHLLYDFRFDNLGNLITVFYLIN